MTRTRPWDVQVVADSDSRWKWGVAMARRLGPDTDVRVHAALLRGRSTPTGRQLRDTGVTSDSLRRLTLPEAVADLADTKADVVVLACLGGSVQALLRSLSAAWAGRPDRPVVVTGYVGLVYERVIDGLLLRAGADVILANSAADARTFRQILRDLDANADAVVQTSLPFLGGPVHDAGAAGRDRPFTVTFVTQPGVPETRRERRYAVMQAAEHANLHRDRDVVVKLRGRPGERTTHVEPHHYASLLPARRTPDNFEWAYGSMTEVLDRTDLCVTVSSTAAVEAMYRHIPTAVLTDFGIREALGNQVFLGSGAYAAWPALHSGHVPKTDPGWASDNGVHDDDPFTAGAARVAELVGSAALPPLQPWWNAADAAGYLPDLLAKHGVDVNGIPLSAQAMAGHEPSWPRRAVGSAARKSYHLGVRTLEPRIKRLAQL